MRERSSISSDVMSGTEEPRGEDALRSTGEQRLAYHRNGAAYINPPFVHKLFSPLSSLKGESWPKVRL